MIVAILNVYLALLFILVKLKVIPFNLFWKVSPFVVFLLLLIGLFVPMGWGAPQGNALVVRNAVSIVPDVAGEVTEVPVLPLSPVMAFIDTSDTLIGVEINQIDARYSEPGQMAEVTFKFAPGRVFTGKVESILQAIATGQVQTSGVAVAPKAIEAVPFVVRVRLDDTAFAQRLPAGATGTAAIFTEHVRVAHIIRRVLLRQVAILNYINPF